MENSESMKESAHIDQSSSSEAKQPNYRLRRAGVALGLTAVVAGGAGKLIDGAFFKPDRERNIAEATIIEEMRTGERPTVVEEAVIVLRPGAIIREQPEMTTDKPGMHNEERTLSGNEALVIDRPITYVDDRGHTWIGFKIGEGEVEPTVDKDEDDNIELPPAATSLEVGEGMSWVNMTVLRTQINQDTKQPYMEILPTQNSRNNDTMFANIDSRGVVTFGFEDNAEEVAVAREIDVVAAELFINSFAQQR